MFFYKLDYVVDETLKQNLSAEQLFLKKLTGKRLSAPDASILLERIGDHKWYISEKLGRDVGFNVAAIDFLENIYEPGRNSKNPRNHQPFNFAKRKTLLMLT